jgi:enoyl-CoA hydratase
MAEEAVLTEADGGVVLITLNRPDARNAINAALAAGVAAALDRLDGDDEIKVGILTGAGRGFSAGMDLKAFVAGESPHVEGRGLAGIAQAPPRKPIIAAIEGFAVAGGLEIALACDLIVASPKANFGLVEKVVGLTPSMGGTQRFAERAGSGRARQFVLSGEIYGAEELEGWGVVNTIFAADEFEQRSRALAEELAAGPTKAHAMTKQILRRFREGGMPAADEVVRSEAADLFASDDLQGAVKTFLEHGGPGHAKFQGR